MSVRAEMVVEQSLNSVQSVLHGSSIMLYIPTNNTEALQYFVDYLIS